MKKFLISLFIILFTQNLVFAEVITACKFYYEYNQMILRSVGPQYTYRHFFNNFIKFCEDPNLFKPGWSTPMTFDACKFIVAHSKENKVNFDAELKTNLTWQQRVDMENSINYAMIMSHKEAARGMREIMKEINSHLDEKQNAEFIKKFR